MTLGCTCPLMGVVVRDSEYAAIGGVVRDHDGNWIVGFTHFLGVCSLFVAEFWTILDGILILLNKGYKQAIIMTDNLEVTQNLTNLDLEDLGITVLRRTQHIMQPEGEWKIKHIPRNQNLVADHLAKLSLSWKLSLQVINEAPKRIIDLLQVDKIEYEFVRVVASATSVSLEFLVELLVDCVPVTSSQQSQVHQRSFLPLLFASCISENMLSKSPYHCNSLPRSPDVSYPTYNNDMPDREPSLAIAAAATVLESYLAPVPDVVSGLIVPITPTDSSKIAIVNDVNSVTTNVHLMQKRSKSEKLMEEYSG
ncbi:hypothetical protein PVK06_011891 [Gossypium arboreum]|uniref:RNase H type-1 domain-containing protein n=1 Tax=Gossypium arboreum TaxID=29729 RepID=A0ABR0QAR1_GOSAR|nr:hypothetical protein PVK06_011891 [Gossypium arboreum]